MDPLVSIIVPAYQAENTLDRLIKSIQNQSIADWELIIINDGSRDQTAHIIDNWTNRDPRVFGINQPNQGVSAARNRGIEQARGKWVSFADSDDFLPPDALEQLLRGIDEAELVCGGFNSPSKASVTDGQVAKWSAQDLLRMIVNPAKYQPIPRNSTNFDELFERSPCGKLYQHSVLKEHRVRFDPNLIVGEDALFNILYLSRVHKISTVNKETYFYDRSVSANTGSYSKEVVLQVIRSSPLVFASLLPLVDENVITQDDIYHYLADEAMRVFRRAAREAQSLTSAAYDIDTIRADPLLNKALEYYHRPNKSGEIINRCYIKLIKARLSLMALLIERGLNRMHKTLYSH